MITFPIKTGKYLSYIIKIYPSNPITTCEIWFCGLLLSYGISYCRPTDDYSLHEGVHRAVKSALRRKGNRDLWSKVGYATDNALAGVKDVRKQSKYLNIKTAQTLNLSIGDNPYYIVQVIGSV